MSCYFLSIILYGIFLTSTFGSYRGILEPEDALNRAEEVRVKRTEQWTKGLAEGAKCCHKEERCGLGLVCKHNSTAGVNYCVPVQIIEMPKEEEDVDVLPKEGSICILLCSPGLICNKDAESNQSFCQKITLSDVHQRTAYIHSRIHFLSRLRSRMKRKYSSPSTSPSPSRTPKPSTSSSPLPSRKLEPWVSNSPSTCPFPTTTNSPPSEQVDPTISARPSSTPIVEITDSSPDCGFWCKLIKEYVKPSSSNSTAPATPKPSRTSFPDMTPTWFGTWLSSYANAKTKRIAQFLGNVATIAAVAVAQAMFEEYTKRRGLDPKEYAERSSEVFSQTTSWTEGLSLGEKCTHEGVRCSIPLACEGNYCVNKPEKKISEKESDEKLLDERIVVTKGTKLGDLCEVIGELCSADLVCQGDGQNGINYCIEKNQISLEESVRYIVRPST